MRRSTHLEELSDLEFLFLWEHERHSRTRRETSRSTAQMCDRLSNFPMTTTDQNATSGSSSDCVRYSSQSWFSASRCVVRGQLQRATREREAGSDHRGRRWCRHHLPMRRGCRNTNGSRSSGKTSSTSMCAMYRSRPMAPLPAPGQAAIRFGDHQATYLKRLNNLVTLYPHRYANHRHRARERQRADEPSLASPSNTRRSPTRGLEHLEGLADLRGLSLTAPKSPTLDLSTSRGLICLESCPLPKRRSPTLGSSISRRWLSSGPIPHRHTSHRHRA